MRDQVALLAFVTVTAVLQQAYFSMQVIWARRKYKVSPPATSGPPGFERIFRAQLNCSEYFPLFISVLWVAGIFFHQGIAAISGLAYLYARFEYFHRYAESAQGRLKPMYISATVIWFLIGLSLLGLLEFALSSYYGYGEKESLLCWLLKEYVHF
ncbi:leukotriene C4 synthase-like [Bombina bombina]|uniref:leukotriene C4 synthase-like n=1 Tax=Bombina bombina TaxID=8345 RepID=UPI00235AC5E1|nr:leukotriene C4 synthase-like [Bombina bombina]